MTREPESPAGSPRRPAHPGPEFSVIVPTLDEETRLDETLRRAKSALGPEAEVVVVDGGSRDRTAGIAADHGRVLSTRPNRGAQLAAGARAATGEVLVFLHADTWLPDGAGTAIRAAVRAGAEAGCFRFALDPDARGWRYRLLEWGVNWRTRRLHTATGDQALFATRDAYEACGGFRDLPLFEDVTFVRAVRRVARFRLLPLAARTSSRRWETGFLRTVVRHWALRAAFLAGADPRRLRRYHERPAGITESGVPPSRCAPRTSGSHPKR
ncbi:TIGR04283 family arsenosugar biosynthesis glycosyltransferase [Candidatus Palauibacter irciniicola]|uniref:TIGR04283 family arsenosugar biosynthesis glycosyltransferase n=1 Tax=Candidatus Palauibacter irciniicola TaxID=3056733 RepID=UPI003B017998